MDKENRSSLGIVSGGQTGVDRGALDAAMALGVTVGGWCPEGRLAEDGPIHEKYPLRELKGGGYQERTRKNVVDSDGTVIIYFDDISGGTELTYNYCVAELKPHLLINGLKMDETGAVNLLDEFVKGKGIQILNVAGPRASKDSRGYDFTYHVIYNFLKSMSR